MRKPELQDFGLSETLVEKNKQQHQKCEEMLKVALESRKSTRKTILIVSLVITAIAFIIVAATGFETEATGIVMGICLFWDATYGIIYFQYSGETVWDLSYEKRKQIEAQVIDEKIENAIEKYNKAMAEYEKSRGINEYSIVKAEMLIPPIMDNKEYTSLGTGWMVFSNIHLRNPQSYPDLALNTNDFSSFESKYFALIERQKSAPPKAKKNSPIPQEEKLEFYYPCSDMYMGLKEKKEGEIVELPIGMCYKILKVINLDD